MAQKSKLSYTFVALFSGKNNTSASRLIFFVS